MSGVLAILRLWARPGTPWNLLVVATIASLLGRGAWLVQQHLGPTAIAGFGANERGWQIAALLFTGAAGSLLGWTVSELLLTPQAPLLPGLRRELRRGFLALGGACAGAAALAYAAAGGAHPWPVVLALGAAAFGAGALASDPSLPRGSAWAVLLVTLAELVWLPRILEVLSAAPLASSAALLALGLAAIELFLRPGALRRRPLLSVADLGLAYRSDAASVDPTMNGARGQRLRVRLPEGRIEGDDGWMRAAFLENFGWMRGGVAGAFFGHALFWMVFCLAQTALFFPNREALSAAARGSPQGSYGVASLLATTTALFWITNSLALRTSAGYPVSRAERARALWRAALVTNVGLHLVLALVLLAVTLLVARFAGESWRPPSPDFARVLALSLLASPIVQGARLCFIDGKARAPTSLELGLLAGIAIIALVVTLVLGAELSRELLADVPPALQALTALALFAAAQSVWRAFLVRRFSTCELVA